MSISTQDLIAGFDPTAQTTITAAQLLQLVQSAVPNTAHGFVLVSADINDVPQTPDAAVTTQWQNYVWLRQQSSSVIAYVWNPNASSVSPLLKWQAVTSANIADGSITTAMIASKAVTADKILSIPWSLISGYPDSYPPNGDASGDLTGSYPDPSIGIGAITGTKIAAHTIGPGKLGTMANSNAAVDISTNIDASGLTPLAMVRVKSDGTGLEAVTKLVTQMVEPTGVNNNQLLQVNSSHSAIGYLNLNGAGSPGRVLQVVTQKDNTADSVLSTDGTTLLSAPPLVTDGKSVASGTLDLIVTPLSSSSELHIEVVINAAISYSTLSTSVSGAFVLFTSLSNTAINAASLSIAGTASIQHYQHSVVTLSGKVTGHAAGVPLTVKIRFGIISASLVGTISYNPDTVALGGCNYSSVKVTEIQ
jgi:hypothetical protein